MTEAVAASPIFLLSVAVGAGATVILASLLGFPVSTTHGLIGALIGAGLLAAGDRLDFGVLSSTFFLPLLVSPVISVILTIVLYRLAREVTTRAGITSRVACVSLPVSLYLPWRTMLTVEHLLKPSNARTRWCLWFA